jgi:membrane protein YdbS with pleckstrin-like domain
MSESPVGDVPGQPRPPSVLVFPSDEQPSAPPTAELVPACARRPPSLATVDATQENDLHWASYSGWAMLPSFLVCFLLTGGIAWFGFAVARPMAQAVILGAGGVVWLVQLARWAHRVFSFTYRLTNRRLFIDRGLWFPDRLQVLLSGIDRVEVEQGGLEEFMGLGRVRLRFRDERHETLLLTGIREPQTFARLIDKARATTAR